MVLVSVLAIGLKTGQIWNKVEENLKNPSQNLMSWLGTLYLQFKTMLLKININQLNIILAALSVRKYSTVKCN